MMKLARDNAAVEESRDAVLKAVDHMIDLCRAAMPDVSVDREIRELEALKSAIVGKWPLDDRTKRKLDIGVFAAKNIEDWNPALADRLMRFDHDIRNGVFAARPVGKPEPAVCT